MFGLNKTDLESYQNIAFAFNNHFAGFGLQSADTFLKIKKLNPLFAIKEPGI